MSYSKIQYNTIDTMSYGTIQGIYKHKTKKNLKKEKKEDTKTEKRSRKKAL